MDFKSAFWQLELEPKSRYLTVFHANDKLYRYKRLTMGLKPSQGELNVALQPLFAHIRHAHLIYDDLIVAAPNQCEHDEAVLQVMQAIKKASLTLNAMKCHFGETDIEFWGLLIGAEGVRPDPAKVKALQHITPPTSREELVSFLCMMQSNSDFVPNFSQMSSKLREMTKSNANFKWTTEHQIEFVNLIQAFRKDTLLRYFDLGKRTFLFTDAHISGLGAILAQGETVDTARPVAFASRTTSPAEKRYPQIDLEATAVDFALRRFRNYLVGAPDIVNVITDHKPLGPIFNGNRTGSIRTERIKLRHQDIRFKVSYQPGKKNQADFLSRHAKPLEKLPLEEQTETSDLNNLLYLLHTTPIMDHIGIARIAKHTSEDRILQDLRAHVENGQTWIPKDNKELSKFATILPEITVTGNGILLKGERIILSESLHEVAIELAHRGSHPGQTGLVRRLRYHFFFHDMNNKVQRYVSQCLLCQSFSEKKTAEPITSHNVPSKCWEQVAVDLFGPMPSSHHVVVVQDMASRYPAAKLVSSTKAAKVLPALRDIYNEYGSPEFQLSDNGPPFNSSAMETFARTRDIELQKIPPLHPSANPVETFMKPLGKTMKTAKRTNMSEKDALQHLLNNYRNTPYPATGIPPAAMLFRDGQHSVFPRTSVTQEAVDQARLKDEACKLKREEGVKALKYRQAANFEVGESVLLKNFKKTSKLDPNYIPEKYTICSTDGRTVVVERDSDGSTLRRHPDHLKRYEFKTSTETPRPQTEEDILRKFHVQFETVYNDSPDSNDSIELTNGQQAHRQPHRIRRHNPRYFNDEFIN